MDIWNSPEIELSETELKNAQIGVGEREKEKQ